MAMSRLARWRSVAGLSRPCLLLAGSRRASLVLSRSVPRPLSGMPTMASSNCSLLHAAVGVVGACS
eukprot:6489425-Pyramimonas_sp.AAC.1